MKKIAREAEVKIILPIWSTAKLQPSGVVEVYTYSPPKAVWAVCYKYLLEPSKALGTGSSWKSNVSSAFHSFMSKEYVGPGDMADMETAFTRIVFAALELKKAISILPACRLQNPVSLADDVSFEEVLNEVIADYDHSLSRVTVKRGRGAPKRTHVGNLAKVLINVYHLHRRPRKSKSPALFLAEVERAFFESEKIAIGFPKRLTQGFSDGSRALRRSAK